MRASPLGSFLGLAMLAAAPAALAVTPPPTGSTGDTGALVATAPGSTGDTGVPTVGDGTGQTGDTGTTPPAETGGTGASTGTDTGAPIGGTGGTGGASRLATAIADEVGGVRCDTTGASGTRGLGLAWAITLGVALRRRRFAAATAFTLVAGLVAAPAHAGPPPEPTTPQRDVHLVARGLVERWNDPAIATVYKSGTWLGAIGVAVDVIGPIGLDVEAGFGRLRAEGSSFEIAPLSALVSFTAPLGRVDAYAALGPAWTVFTETGGATAVDGARLAGELRGGVRIDTGLIQPARPPAPAPVRALELEVYLARRSELPGGATGLHLGAWRGSVGLGVVF